MKRGDFRPLDLQGTAGHQHRPAASSALVGPVRDELTRVCDAIASSTGVRALVGPEVQVSVARDPKTRSLMFIVVPL